MADQALLAFAKSVTGSTSQDAGTVINAAMSNLASAITSVSTSGQVTWAKGQTIPPVAVAATTLTLSPVTHDGHPVVINSAAGCTVTLPAATGSGSRYFVVIGTTLTSSSFVLQVANASDFMRGQASTIGSSGITIAITSNTGTVSTESDTITWNRTTTGLGTIGDYIEAWDIATNIWQVDAVYASSGAAATPFSAAV